MSAETLSNIDDFSGDFQSYRKALSNNPDYIDFVKGLKPNYARVWLDIGLGYAFLIITMVIQYRVETSSLIWGFTLLPLSGISIGFWIAYIRLFAHEAAHHNLASNPKLNDLLADLFIGWQTGSSTEKYRKVHFKHHTHIGKPEDTEHSYFFAPTLKYILTTLTGLRALEVILFRMKVNKTAAAKEESKAFKLPLVALWGIFLHICILGSLAYFDGWLTALSWLGGLGSCAPFFLSLRQMIEHRKPDAKGSENYKEEPHGAYTRIFDDGVFARFFGGAGFNKHILHHWEPKISYTRLSELEAYLEKTDLQPVLAARRTTYWSAFKQLLQTTR